LCSTLKIIVFLFILSLLLFHSINLWLLFKQGDLFEKILLRGKNFFFAKYETKIVKKYIPTVQSSVSHIFKRHICSLHSIFFSFQILRKWKNNYCMYKELGTTKYLLFNAKCLILLVNINFFRQNECKQTFLGAFHKLRCKFLCHFFAMLTPSR
jgi:hypothetical protein